MELKHVKIATQLKTGFAMLLLLVAALGVVSYIHSNKLHQQTESIYEHPLKVRNAINDLEIDILSMRLGTRDLMLATSDREKQAAIQAMEVAAADVPRQFDILYRQYLGPRTDVDDAYNAFTRWKSARDVNTRLALSGDVQTIKESILSTGTVGIQRDQMMAKIQKIDLYAQNKSEALYEASRELHDSLIRQLILLVVSILLLSLIINYTLLRNIRTPLEALTDAARSFHEGDMTARSACESTNEFGLLSDSFNSLADSIQHNTDVSEKSAILAGTMLSEDDAERFFHATLAALAAHTSSQLAAVYLLNDDKTAFEHFNSIGMDGTARGSFAADGFEGEFGAALASRTVQHLKNIPEDTRFVFHTAGGRFIPREIITIPILAGSEVIAVISLASVGIYSTASLQLIDSILDTLSSRIAGILAYRKVKAFSRQMEQQNRELETQKSELTAQSTELMAQNTELEMQKKQLDEASRLKTNFLSNMSHELRTPLNSVIALSGVLNRRLASRIPEEEYSYLEVIERNGKQLLSLINDILDIARIEAGREEIEITRFNTNSLISDIADMIRPQARQKEIELLHADNGTDLAITSDAMKCRHILQNLIGNAVKFTETGKVEITARQNGDSIEITVADTGIGIDGSHLPHIFDEFRQADGSTSRKFGGTGLGLAIAKKYACLLGGRLTVSSTPDKGSEFTLVLPLHYTAEHRVIDPEAAVTVNQSIKTAPRRPVSETAEKTILLVEDSEPAIVQLKDILEEGGYRILVARDGAEALGIIEQTVPDAMVLDLMMPGIDGFDVLKTIREAERTAHIPVLILTARHISKEELGFLKRNNIHQLIQKGDVNRGDLQNAVTTMAFPEQVPTEQPQRERRPIQGKPLLLVVEDNPDNMLTVKAILADNYRVIEASDGREGVEMARKHKPDLILMDIALPGMDGVEAFKAIRNDARLQHVPIIALTASAMVSDRETILAHGFDAYVAKPIDDRLFFKSINEALYGV